MSLYIECVVNGRMDGNKTLRQEEIAARLAAAERRLQLVNAKHARPARRKPGAKPLLELVK
jgi:hypothetical protein